MPNSLDRVAQVYIIHEADSLSWLTLAVPHRYAAFGTSGISVFFFLEKKRKCQQGTCVFEFIHVLSPFTLAPLHGICLFFHPLWILNSGLSHNWLFSFFLCSLASKFIYLLMSLSLFSFTLSFIYFYVFFSAQLFNKHLLRTNICQTLCYEK